MRICNYIKSLQPRTPSLHYQGQKLVYYKDKHSTNTDNTSVGSGSLGKPSSRLSKSSPISSESSTVSTISGTIQTAGWRERAVVEGVEDGGMLGKLTEEKQEGIYLDLTWNWFSTKCSTKSQEFPPGARPLRGFLRFPKGAPDNWKWDGKKDLKYNPAQIKYIIFYWMYGGKCYR